MNCINSPTQKIKFNDIELFIKRDDLLSREFSGNKARKFYFFLELDFKNIKKIVSYGSPQANSLYSYASLAKIKGVKLDFYVNHISSYLKENPQGNYKHAMDIGANIIEVDVDDFSSYIQDEIMPKETDSVFIEEGGRVQEAQVGVKLLASEITLWAKENDIKDLKIILPAGTGTTALFLQKNIEFEVLTCACVGDEKYLKEQFFELSSDEKDHPTIMKRDKKYHFGKLYKEFYDVYKDLYKQTNIEFELLYDPVAWLSFLKYLKEEKTSTKTQYLYIHQGGIIGNESMLPRYERKFT